MPGFVSTLLNHMYSAPGRFVQTLLHVTEHVWHPMHLSRFMTIATCARTLHQYSTSEIRLRTTMTSSRWVPHGP